MVWDILTSLMMVTSRGMVALGVATVILIHTGDADAQIFLQSERPGNYVAFASLPGVQNATPIVFGSADEGVATVPIPFAFNYLGQAYTSLRVGTNGFVTFGNGGLPGYTNYAPGSLNSENNSIFMWWDDLILPNGAGYADHGVMGTAPNRTFIIEVRSLEHWSYSTRPEINLQLWLFEGATGRFEVHYDGVASSVENYSAAVGYEGDTGNGDPFGVFRTCAEASPYCDEIAYNTLSGRILTVEQAIGPEIVGSVGNFGRGVLPGQTANGPVTINNVGTVDATNVVSTLYLSTDNTLDALDVNVGVVTNAVLTANDNPVTTTATITVPAQIPPGDYFVLLEVDTPNAVAEVEETNNVSVSATRFATAYEVAPVAITAQSGGNPGDMVTFDLELSNVGVPYVGPMMIEIRASDDNVYAPAQDPLLGTYPVAMSGAASQTLQFTATLPQLAPADYQPVLVADTGGVVLEYDETNQVLVGAVPFPSGPDFSATAVTVPPGANPGTAITFGLTVLNAGVAYSGPLQIRVQASPDAIFDVNDPDLGVANVTLNGLASETVQVTVTVPQLAPGAYFPLFRLDPNNQVPEIRDFDNNFVGADRFSSGPNFTIEDITADPEAAPGAPINITTRIGSVGAPYTGAVGYRLLLSTDRTLDAQDVLLGTYTVQFAGEAFQDDIRTPGYPVVPPVAHYVIAQVDPGAQLAEVNENDNTLADDDDIQSGPDFRINNVDFTPRDVTRGDSVFVDFDLRVEGSPFTGAVTYRVVLSEDSSLEATDLEVGRGGIGVQGLGTVSFTSTVTTTNATPGRYYIFVEADPDDIVNERSETNNASRDFTRLTVGGPNLVAGVAPVDPIVFRGRTFDVTITVDNLEDAPTGSFRYAYYIVQNNVLSTGTELFRSPVVQLQGNAGMRFDDTITVPVGTSTGTYQFGVIVDIDQTVDETEEGDNVALIPGTILISDLVPDLTARIVATATAAAAGENLAFTRLIRNRGVADAPTFEYAYYASTDANVTTADIRLAVLTSSVAEGDVDFGIDVINVPATVPPQDYWISIIVDPGGVVQELDEANNVSVPVMMPVYPAALTVVTDRLPDPRVGIPYEAGIYAVGGTRAHVWSVPIGALPSGLTIDPATGVVAGTADTEGEHTFTVRVMSGVAFADRELMVRVRSATVELAIATRALSVGTIGRAYDDRILAVGGADPYTWTSVRPMPPGLALQPDGRVTGTAEVIGDYTLTVLVRDTEGGVASADVALRIIDPSRRVLITQSPLPIGAVGVDYCGVEPIRLFATGGRAPYRWTILEGAPAGFTLSEEGVLCGTPPTAGAFPFVVHVEDASQTVDTSLFTLEVVAGDRITIATTGLPDAQLAKAYESSVRALAGLEPYDWSIEVGDLPPGVVMNEGGLLSGTPSETGDFAFVVQVVDGSGASARTPLSIRVTDGSENGGDGGCSCSAERESPASPWSLLLVGLVLWRRRR